MKVLVRIVRLGMADYQAQAYLAGWEVVAHGRSEELAVASLRSKIDAQLRTTERLVEIDVSQPDGASAQEPRN